MQDNISKKQIIIMSVAAGVSVANIYYNQPILTEIAASMHVTQAQVGALPVLTQVGYGLGLLLLTPLGDKTDRKKLIIVLQCLLMLSLLCVTLVHTIYWLYVLSLCIGLFSVATQVIMPMAATLALKDKGKVVGIVFTGALTGILGARIFSGFIANWLSWRYVYGISACMLLVTSSMVWVALPHVVPKYKGSYISLLRSVVSQLQRFALLRRVALLGALVFGTFCSFWTTLTFHLSGAPFNYKSNVIGLFGFLAIGGALAASWFGKLADKSSPARTQLFTVAGVIGSILCIQVFSLSVAAFIVAIILLDICVQATQVSSLAQIYTLDETAHSRINTVYMTCMFIGGAAGTWAGVHCWAIGGWMLVCWQLLLWSVIALLVAYAGYKVYRRNKAGAV